MTIVMKFGGTSLGARAPIETAIGLVRRELPRSPIVVCSAHSRVTDLLLEGARAAAAGKPDLGAIVAREREILDDLRLKPALVAADLERLDQMFKGLALIGELTPRSLDTIAAFGERMSVKAIAAAMRRRKVAATPVMADEAGLVTDSRFMRATPLPAAYANLRAHLAKVEGVPVVTGFIARDLEGNVTTLGRSGSDYTATIIGNAVGAEEVQIWKDVPGVLTADPRIVPEARPVARITYAEASELAYYGAKVIHPATIHPCVERGIPVRILNTMRPDDPGTVIEASRPRGGLEATCIASKRGIDLVNIVSGRMLGQSGFMATVFDAFRRHDVVVDLVATSEVSVTVSVDHADGLEAVLQELGHVAAVGVDRGNALVAVVGERMKDASGLAGRVFAAIGEAGVPIRAISYGATKTNLQIVVPADRTEQVVRTLHRVLFPEAVPATARD